MWLDDIIISRAKWNRVEGLVVAMHLEKAKGICLCYLRFKLKHVDFHANHRKFWTFNEIKNGCVEDLKLNFKMRICGCVRVGRGWRARWDRIHTFSKFTQKSNWNNILNQSNQSSGDSKLYLWTFQAQKTDRIQCLSLSRCTQPSLHLNPCTIFYFSFLFVMT